MKEWYLILFLSNYTAIPVETLQDCLAFAARTSAAYSTRVACVTHDDVPIVFNDGVMEPAPK